MKQNVIETVLGAVVLLVALGFLVFAYGTADVRKIDGYTIFADFSSIDGIKAGNDVRISGVKVGTINRITLNEDNYRARIQMSIDNSIKLPLDTVAVISSESLLGGKYLGLEPGGDEEFLVDGDSIEYTQSTPSLEKLIGQVIYSVGDKKDETPASSATAPLAEPTPAPVAPLAPVFPSSEDSFDDEVSESPEQLEEQPEE